jgi:hypothetical protein
MASVRLPRVAEHLLKCVFSQNIAHDFQDRAVVISAALSQAQYLELTAAGDVLEDQRFAGAKRSSKRVQDE